MIELIQRILTFRSHLLTIADNVDKRSNGILGVFASEKNNYYDSALLKIYC